MSIQLTDCIFGYARRPVVCVEQLRLQAGRCVGVFGPNGSGKTTLVRGLTGLLTPLSGRIERAASVRFGYLPQHRAMDTTWPMTALDAATLAVSARSLLGWVGRRARRR